MGEGLVDTRLGDGFHVVMIDAPALQDLSSWNTEVLLLAVRSWLPTASPAAAAISAAKIAEIPSLFAEIAPRSEHADALRAVMSLNDRLPSPGLSEPLQLSGIAREFATMRQHGR